jgi:hypothetical protein
VLSSHYLNPSIDVDIIEQHQLVPPTIGLHDAVLMETVVRPIAKLSEQARCTGRWNSDHCLAAKGGSRSASTLYSRRI